MPICPASSTGPQAGIRSALSRGRISASTETARWAGTKIIRKLIRMTK